MISPNTSRRHAREGLDPIEQRAVRLDERLVSLARGRGALDLAIGETLLALQEGDRLIKLGFSRMVDYARERLGITARSAYFFTGLARGLHGSLLLRRAVVAGAVSPRKAMTILSAARGEDEAAWVAAAMALRLKELELLMKGAGKEPGNDSFEVETLILRMTPEEQDRLDAAIGVAHQLLGYGAPRHQCLEAIAAEWLGGHPEGLELEEDPQVRTAPPGDGSEDALTKWRLSARAVRSRIEIVEEARDWLGSLDESVGAGPEELDARARRLVEEKRAFDGPFGEAAARFFAEKLWRVLGYRSRGEYCRERLGLSERSVRQRLWLERKMQALPELRAALACGRVTYSKALIVAKGATRANVARRIAGVASTSWQEAEHEATTEEERQNRALGVRRIWGPRDAAETVAEALAAAQTVAAARGSPISAGEALARMGDHFRETWEPEIRRRRRPKDRQEVLMRNRGLCAWPGCSRGAVHDHHIEYRSRGGSDDLWNRIGLCAVHHLRGIHHGYLELTGRAGEEVTFRARGPLRAIVSEWRLRGKRDLRRAGKRGSAPHWIHDRPLLRRQPVVELCAAAWNAGIRARLRS